MNRHIEILLVDDEDSHRLLALRALRRAFPSATIHQCRSVAESLALVSDPNLPLTLAIVDLNVGGESGLKVVHRLLNDQRWGQLPVLVISTSELESDVEAAYQHKVSAYIVKDSDPKLFAADLTAGAKFLLRCSDAEG